MLDLGRGSGPMHHGFDIRSTFTAEAENAAANDAGNGAAKGVAETIKAEATTGKSEDLTAGEGTGTGKGGCQ